MRLPLRLFYLSFEDPYRTNKQVLWIYIFTRKPCNNILSVIHLCYVNIFVNERNTRIFLSIDCECEYLKQKIRFKISRLLICMLEPEWFDEMIWGQDRPHTSYYQVILASHVIQGQAHVTSPIWFRFQYSANWLLCIYEGECQECKDLHFYIHMFPNC